MSLARVGARVRGSHIWCPWGTLYNEVQGIVGNGHMGTPSPLWRERHYWKHYLPRTSLADSKKRLYGYMVGYPWSARYKTPDLQNIGITDPKQGVMFFYFQEVRSTTSILELGHKSMNRWHPILVNNSRRTIRVRIGLHTNPGNLRVFTVVPINNLCNSIVSYHYVVFLSEECKLVLVY